MNEIQKTAAFILTAFVLAAGSLFHHLNSRPRAGIENELVGKPFFEAFDSSTQAAALEVFAVDPETLARQSFRVRNEKGVWIIPSHHNYPAEATNRLAETATSVMGIVRESLAGSRADFARLGVLDPTAIDEAEIDDPESVGQRITLRDSAGEVLVDFIIGKPAGEISEADLDPAIISGSDTLKYYYIRHRDEQQVYKARLDIDLSTRFSDWIDPDLLRLDTQKVVRIDVDNYQLTEERQGLFGQVKALFKEQGDRIILNRDSFTTPWTMDGLDKLREELNSTRIVSTLEILSDLIITGVRPKFKYNDQLLLTPDLQLNRIPELEQNIPEAQAAVDRFQEELDNLGFSLAGTQDQLEIASANGQIQIGTNEGVLYTLQIGKVVEGEANEIEIGGAKSVEDIDTEEEMERIASYQEEERNRYVMIRVSFDETLLGPAPQKPAAPVEPTQPDGYQPPEDLEAKEEQSADQADDNSQQQGDDKQQESAATEQQETDQDDQPPARDPAFVAYDQAMAEYRQAKIDYELELTRYEDQNLEHQKRVAEGKVLVDILNQRFGDWYYVVKGSNLRALQFTREDIVRISELDEVDDFNAAGSLPNFGIPQIPNISFPEIEED